MLAHLGGYVGPCWGYVAHVGAMLAHLGAMLAQLGRFFGPMLGHVDRRKSRKVGQAKNTVKRGSFGRSAHGRRQGSKPLSPTERRECLRQGHGLGASGAPGRIGPSGAYVVPAGSSGYVGVSGGHLEAKSPGLRAIYVGVSGGHLEAKSPRSTQTPCHKGKTWLSPGGSGAVSGLGWPSLGAMLAHSRDCVGHSWAIFGLCGAILRLCLAYLGPMLPHLDLLLAHLRHMSSDLASVLAQTKRKRKKPWKTQWKTKVFGNHLGARLAHLRGYVGPSWGYVGPAWGYLDPAWGLCWPILTLCWPILGPCWPNLGTFFGLCWAMLTHLEPQSRNNGRSRKHCKTRDCTGVGGGVGGQRLSPSERRDCLRQAFGPLGPLAGFKGLRPTAGQGPKQRACSCRGSVIVMVVVVCWPILGAMLAHSRGCVGHSWAIFGLCGAILRLCLAYPGPMLPHLDFLLAHLRHMSSDLASVLAQTKRKRKKPWKKPMENLGFRQPSWG